MSSPREILIQDYQYDLPDNRIASHPLPERDQSKLLIYKDGLIQTSVYKELAEHLEASTLLIFNDTKVVEARILFQKSTGGRIEIFCLEPADNTDVVSGMSAKGKVRWNCLVGGAAKWKQPYLEKKIADGKKGITLKAVIIQKKGEVFEIEFSWEPSELLFAEVLHQAGIIPLPPYLQRSAEQSDYERYQTVYAKEEGSVAAPTAGLHFTSSLLKRLEEKGIHTSFVTLHVGAGTFLPVKTESIGGHEMHREWIRVTDKFLQQLKSSLAKPIIPVGTTSLRTLESLYWMGVKASHHPEMDIRQLEVQQWDPYEWSGRTIHTAEALEALIQWMQDRKLQELLCQTQLLIAPGYSYKLADALITNFHQPGSTLLLLVAALIGEDWKKAYQYALDNDFRFLSYGDGSLLWKHKRMN
jgi:S-adenosylmethionine:tRNA ribosyltransferase-isomerase